MRRWSWAVAVLTTGALTCSSAVAAQAAVPTDTSALRNAVTLEGVRAHQQQFQEFADLSGGTREASTLGFQLSADYVAGLMEAAGYEVTRQPFEYNYYEELGPPVVTGTSPGFPFIYTDGENISTMDYSGSGTVSGVVQGVNDNIVPLPVGQPDSTSNAGCEDADFEGFTGDIALIQRGTCFFYEKIANAVEAGADAVIIFNEGNSAERTGIDFGQASFPQDVPVIEMSAEAGAALVEYIEAEAAAGRQVTLTVTTSTLSEVRESENVIAQTTTGRTDRVIVSGAHLDSVIEGPGINDNGSGSAAQLEVALQMAELGIEPVNQVRFIWFGAEEAGLVGSAYYVSQLTKRELKDIAVMLNFDMVGSPNAGWFVYDGDASDTASTGSTGSGVVEDVFVDFFESIGRETEPTAFDGRSDYDAFVAAGIPAGGLFTGAEDLKTAEQAAKWGGTAGIAFDPCYHQACDTFANVR
jgi:Zn-dependent M28 family amino/carboxypeptidase